jgi:hypothetical protein
MARGRRRRAGREAKPVVYVVRGARGIRLEREARPLGRVARCQRAHARGSVAKLQWLWLLCPHWELRQAAQPIGH